MKKILALVSNPKGSSNLDLLPEIRNLQEALERSLNRERFSVEWRVAVRQSDLRRHILDVKPQMIHFCGHGEREGLLLEDERGKVKLAENESIVDLLKNFADRIECVLLNACNSESLADLIVKHLNYAIGMNRPVFDDAAIAFTAGFYDTLGAGESIERAFEFGKNAVLGTATFRNAQSRKLTPVKENDNPTAIQNREYLIPVLKQNPQPTPIKPIWLNPKQERKAVRELLQAIEDSFNKIRLFHTTEPIVLQDQYIPVQVTLERRYQHTVETTWGYAESEAELKRVYALKGSGEEEIKQQQVDWQEAKRQESRIVVLADPGMGKSTLLRMEVCRTVARSYEVLDNEQSLAEITIPLLIRLATLAEKVVKMPVFEAILETIRERHSNLLKHNRDAEAVAFLNDFLKEQLLKGKCVLLLDALDEVTPEKRHRLIQKLNDFARAYPSCPIIGTSRIVGYGGKLIDGAKDVEIVPFTQKETEQYIKTWFTNAQESLTDKSVTAKGLIQALRDRPQIAGLAQNPLLLSLICSLYQRDKLTLPARRGQIYQQSVNYMLDEWRRTRPSYSSERTQAKIRLLEAMAYYFTCQEREVFEYEELYDWVEEFLEAGNAPRDLRDAKTGELIAELSEEDGILQKLYRDENDDQYLFLHRTFQEYFTASYLNWIIKKKPEDGIALVRQYFWNYDWHETLTLLASLMKQPMVLIEAILSTRDDIFNTQLLLAGRCIAECNEISDPTIDRAIDRIYQFWLKYPNFEFISSVVMAIAQTYGRLVQSLNTSLQNKDLWVRSDAAKSLGKIGNDKAVDGLNTALQDKDLWVRSDVAKSLGKIGNDKAVDGLITALQDADSRVRYYAAEALGKIGNDKAVDGLIIALQDVDSEVRSYAAEALGKIGNDKAVDSLIIALQDVDSWVRENASRALGKIGNDKAVDSLIFVLQDRDSGFRGNAALALGEIGNERAVDSLIAALQDKDLEVGCCAAEALGEIGNERAVDSLIAALQDEHPGVKRNAALALGKIGNDKAVDSLIAALQDGHLGVRYYAAEALGEIGNERAVEGLIAALQDEYSAVRSRAADALDNIGSLSCLEKLLQSRQINIYDKDIFSLARSLAIRFSKQKLPFIPVYPELVEVM